MQIANSQRGTFHSYRVSYSVSGDRNAFYSYGFISGRKPKLQSGKVFFWARNTENRLANFRPGQKFYS